jgi:hypothetical protein
MLNVPGLCCCCCSDGVAGLNASPPCDRRRELFAPPREDLLRTCFAAGGVRNDIVPPPLAPPLPGGDRDGAGATTAEATPLARLLGCCPGMDGVRGRCESGERIGWDCCCSCCGGCSCG